MATPAEIRREKLRNRTTQAAQNRDRKGLGKKSVLDWSKFVGKKPNEFTPQTGKNKNLIDVLLFKITQDWYKDLRTFCGLTTNLGIGDYDYKLELPVHKNVGENNDTLLCLQKAFGRKCIRCEEVGEEYDKDEPNQKTINALKASWRTWYNIYDYDDEENSEGKNGIWEDVSYYLFENQLLEEQDEGEEKITFSDFEFGKSIEFKGKEKKLGKNPFTEAQGISFKDRDAYDESIVEDTISFDALVKICTVDEFTRIHLGLDSDDKSRETTTDDNDSSSSGKRSRRSPKDENADSQPTWKEEDGCPSDLEFGEPDLDSDKCKKCEEYIFNACATKQDLKKATEKEEKKPSGRSRRRKNQK